MNQEHYSCPPATSDSEPRAVTSAADSGGLSSRGSIIASADGRTLRMTRSPASACSAGAKFTAINHLTVPSQVVFMRNRVTASGKHGLHLFQMRNIHSVETVRHQAFCQKRPLWILERQPNAPGQPLRLRATPAGWG